MTVFFVASALPRGAESKVKPKLRKGGKRRAPGTLRAIPSGVLNRPAKPHVTKKPSIHS